MTMARIFAIIGYCIRVFTPLLIGVTFAGGALYFSWFLYFFSDSQFELSLLSGLLGFFGSLIMCCYIFPSFDKEHWQYPKLGPWIDKIIFIGQLLVLLNWVILAFLLFRDLVLIWIY
jgi:hypothetical protein